MLKVDLVMSGFHMLENVNNAIRKCEKCSLCKSTVNKVPGEGNRYADVVFCGEGPGQTESETGRPFVGRAGKMLMNMLASIDLKREDVYILNTCKCRPPNNRKPTPEEMDTCFPFLRDQIRLIQPKIIVALGNSALYSLTGKDGGITKRCGTIEYFTKYDENIKIIPNFHPSGLLRNPKWKESAWHAMQLVKKELSKT